MLEFPGFFGQNGAYTENFSKYLENVELQPLILNYCSSYGLQDITKIS